MDDSHRKHLRIAFLWRKYGKKTKEALEVHWKCTGSASCFLPKFPWQLRNRRNNSILSTQWTMYKAKAAPLAPSFTCIFDGPNIVKSFSTITNRYLYQHIGISISHRLVGSDRNAFVGMFFSSLHIVQYPADTLRCCNVGPMLCMDGWAQPTYMTSRPQSNRRAISEAGHRRSLFVHSWLNFDDVVTSACSTSSARLNLGLTLKVDDFRNVSEAARQTSWAFAREVQPYIRRFLTKVLQTNLT